MKFTVAATTISKILTSKSLATAIWKAVLLPICGFCTFDTNKDGKKELIIVKNLSSVGRIFKNLKLFSSSEIYNLEWDGLGMAENWRTKKINGYVADYML